MLAHLSPIMKALWIVLKRYCWTRGRRTGHFRLFHIVAVVSLVPFITSIASLVACMLSIVSGHGGFGLLSVMPRYAVFWSIVLIFAPCRSNSTGISRLSSSDTSFCAPSFTSLSLSSFPSIPLCPFTHLKDVLADLFFSRYAAFLNSAVLSIPIHPWSSHFLRFWVSPFMTYIESDAISRGMKCGVFCRAAITAASSPIWFDWSVPGILSAVFRGSFRPNHTPPPLLAFSFPLSVQDPSVCIMVSLYLVLAPLFCGRCAESFVVLWGFVKTLKHSDRSSFVVIDGSKIIFPFSSLACLFCSFLLFVSDRLSCLIPGPRGFHFGSVLFILASASVAQSCRCTQSFLWSSAHAGQLQ